MFDTHRIPRTRFDASALSPHSLMRFEEPETGVFAHRNGRRRSCEGA
jgi:hypothetical protein